MASCTPASTIAAAGATARQTSGALGLVKSRRRSSTRIPLLSALPFLASINRHARAPEATARPHRATLFWPESSKTGRKSGRVVKTKEDWEILGPTRFGRLGRARDRRLGPRLRRCQPGERRHLRRRQAYRGRRRRCLDDPSRYSLSRRRRARGPGRTGLGRSARDPANNTHSSNSRGGRRRINNHSHSHRSRHFSPTVTAILNCSQSILRPLHTY
jgi:hypothetical protein